MSGPQWRERPDRPIYEDPRLEDLATLVKTYRNLYFDSDFNDELPKVTQGYKLLYEHYKGLLAQGHHYLPKF